jgi:hypothetical protein
MTTAQGTHRGKPRMAYAKSTMRSKFRSAAASMTGWRLGASILVAAAIAIPVVLTMNDTTGPPSANVNSAIESVFPSRNTLDLRQAVVGVDLSNNYKFISLSIDNKPIPQDQIDFVTALNQASYRPASGKEISTFTPGTHCATAQYEPLEGVQAVNDSGSYTWCFALH